MRVVRLLGKVALGLIGLILVLVVVVLLVNLRDEPLSAKVQASLTQIAPDLVSDRNNAAYLVWAFDAPAGVDASNVGHALVAAYQAVSPTQVANNDWRIRPLYQPAPFDFPAALACIDPDSACIEVALNRPDGVREIVQSKAYLFDRLAQIDSAAVFGPIPLLGPVNAPLPPVKPLIGIYSLSLLQAAVEIREHHADVGIGRLEQDVRIARRLLKTSDGLVMKAISADLLRRAMLAYSEILRAMQGDAATVGLLDASLGRVALDLNADERAMSAVLASEARRAADLARQVANPPPMSDGSLGERIATWAAPLFFKPNATIGLENRLFEIEAPLMDTSAAAFGQGEMATAKQFSAAAEEFTGLKSSAIYNPLGKIMAAYVPDLLDYVARVHDDEALMRAVRAQAALMSKRVPFVRAGQFLDGLPKDMWDPYTGQPFVWVPAESSLALTRHSSRGVAHLKVPLT